MTIYEYIGIDELLIDEPIPIDLIIENIDREHMRFDANVFFEDINRISIRASLDRGNHFLQVIQVDLNNACHIDEISRLIQNAIKYQVLFIFVFEDRYLLLRRSFNVTLSSEHVYTQHASLCTDWIYKENLNPDLLSTYKFNEMSEEYNDDIIFDVENKKTDNNIGEHEYFYDVLSNVEKLNDAINECEMLCLRFLLDWLNAHAIGERLYIEDILDKIQETQAYQLIGDNVFLDKSVVENIISELGNSEFITHINHTGRNPLVYFNNNFQPATYYMIDELTSHLIYGNFTDWYNENDKNAFTSQEFDEFDCDSIHKKFSENKIQLKKYISSCPELPSGLKSDEEKVLAKQIETGNINAKNILIISNLRLVMRIAQKYIGSGMCIDDLIQEGVFGLMKAVDNFDYRLNNRFSTYATYWIKQSITRSIDDFGSLIRVPVYMCDNIYQVKKAQEEFIINNGYEASNDEVAHILNLPLNIVEEANLFSANILSLETTFNLFGISIKDTLIDKESQTIQEMVFDKMFNESVASVLQTLTYREEAVIRFRFGFYGRCYTMEEVGNEFNITRERVRQIEAKALRKLRHPVRSNRLLAYAENYNNKNKGDL